MQISNDYVIIHMYVYLGLSSDIQGVLEKLCFTEFSPITLCDHDIYCVYNTGCSEITALYLHRSFFVFRVAHSFQKIVKYFPKTPYI